MRLRDANKERVVMELALRMIVKEGLEGFSMQKLAKAAGISPATIYIYFKDKDHLIEELCKVAGEKMMAVTFNGFDPTMNFADGLRLQWVNKAKYYMQYPDQMHFLEQLRHSTYGEKNTQMIGKQFKELMGVFLINAIKKKELVKVPVEVFWSIAFAPLYNLVKFHMMGKSLAGKQFVLTDKIMKATFQLVLKALKP